VTADQLADLVRDKSVVLLDFDGPVCSVFAGYPASKVAEELRQIAGVTGTEFDAEDDPLQLLVRLSRILPHDVTRAVADALRDKETQAIQTAQPAPGGSAIIQAARRSGRRISLVSNNSSAAIDAYLRRHALTELVDEVSARYDDMDPRLLKPNTHLLERALTRLDIAGPHAIFVGDSPSDITAGSACDIPTIGYANRPAKKQPLASAGATAVVANLREIAHACIANPYRTRPSLE